MLGMRDRDRMTKAILMVFLCCWICCLCLTPVSYFLNDSSDDCELQWCFFVLILGSCTPLEPRRIKKDGD